MAVQINVAANQAALMQSISAGVQAYNQRFANQNQINLQVNARAFSQPLGRITGDVKDFEAALAASNARVIAFGASTAILGGVIRGFKSIAEITTEVEKNLTDINRVFGLTTKELQKFSTDLFNVSKQTASSFKDASQAALEFSRQGVKAEQVLQRTTDALTLARLAGMNVGNAIEALTATVNGFATTGITTTQVLNKLVAVEQNYAVSAGDLAEALSRTGLAAQEAGVSIDELNALVTAAQEKTARGGAVIGNALKTIFTRLQRPETLDQLEQFNIAVRDVQGNILPATQILKNFAGAYQSLADSQRAQLSEQVAGVYQVNILKAIVSDLNSTQGAYNGALTKGTNATNEAQLATAKLNQSLDALLSQTSTVAQQFANNIGKVTFEPLAKYTAETFKSLFENLNEILEGEGLGSTFANGLLKGIRNILAGPGAIGAFFVLAKLLQNSFSYLTQALPQIVGITTETQNRKNIEAAILQILQGQSIEAQALQGQMGNQAAQAQLLLQIARQQTAEYQRQQALVASLAPQLSRQGVVVGGGGGGLRVTRSKGFLPNFEENSAKSQGATSSVKAVKGVGKIGGKSFIANNQEIQIPNFAGSGETAVIPTYGSGIEKAIGMIGQGKSGSILSNGFIPNLANNASEAKLTYKAKRNTFKEGNEFEDILYKKLYLEDQKPEKGATLDFPLLPLDLLRLARSNNEQSVIQAGVNNQTKFGDAKLSLTYSNITSMISKYLRAKNVRIFGNLSLSDKNYSILYKNGQPDNDIPTTSRSLLSLVKKNPSLFEQVGSNLLDNRYNYYKLNKQGENTKIGLSFYGDRVLDQAMSKGFIPNFGYAGADVIRQAVESGNIEQFRMPGTKTFKFPSGTASEAQVNNIAQRATKGTPGQAGTLSYKGSYNFNSMAVSSADGKQLIDNAYENLVRSKIPNLVSAHDNSVSFSLPFSGGPNSFIDFFDPNSKTFYEAKGGTFSDSEVANKFQNARIDLNNQLNKQLQSWKNTLVYDPNYASKGFIPNFVDTTDKRTKFARLLEPGSGASEAEKNMARKQLAKLKIRRDVGGVDEVDLSGLNNDEALEFLLKNIGSGKEFSVESRFQNILDLLSQRRQATIIGSVSGGRYIDAKMLSKGFLPNFAYKNAVMNLEENLSGQNAILDNTTGPFPFIRNSGQPNFAAAVKDHGGLNQALSDSYRNQVSAGLMSGGFVPNFATLNVQQSLGARFGSLTAQQQTQFLDLNRALSRLARDITLTTQQQQALRQTITTNARALEASTGSTRIVNDANRALATSINQNRNAQNRAAQQTQNTAQTSSGMGVPPILNNPAQTRNNAAAGGSALGKIFSSPAVALVLSNVISQIGSEMAYGGKQRYELSETERMKQSFASQGVTSISTGAFIGSAIAPGVGTVIGGAAGALLAFTKAANDAKLTLSEFKDSISEIAQKQTSAISDYKNNLEQLSKATELGDKKLIEKATKDLSTSFSVLASKNLTANVSGKSIEDLDLIISDINKRAALASSVLSATEKMSTGSKEVSFFDGFMQKAGETLIDFFDSFLKGIKTLGSEIVKFSTSLIKPINEPLSLLKDSLSNFTTYVVSSFDLMFLNIKKIFSSLNVSQLSKFLPPTSIGGFALKALTGNQSPEDLQKQEVQIEEARNKAADDLYNSISKATESAAKMAKNIDAASAVMLLVNPFAGLANIGINELVNGTGERKIQNYDLEQIVSEFVGKGGGAGTSEFYKRIFALGTRGEKGQLMDEQLFTTIETIAKTKPQQDRVTLLENLRETLVNRGVEGQDIDVLIKQVEELSKTGQYKGQFVLTKFKGFVTKLLELDKIGKSKAAAEALQVENFTRIKNSIEDSIRNYVSQSTLNQIAIDGQIQEQKTLIAERSRISEVFGRPFESADVKQQERLLDIRGNFEKDMRKINEDSTKIIDQLKGKVTTQSLADVQRLQQQFTTEDYTPQQRVDLLNQFVNMPQVGFENEKDRQGVLQLIDAQSQLIKERQLQNQNDLKNAQLLLDLEKQRLREARDFGFQLKAGVLSLSDEADLMIGQLGRKIPSAFADGMTNALMQVAKGTESIGDAFKNIAIDFGQMLMQEVMRAAIGKVLGNVFSPLFSQTGGIIGKQKGGIIRAENGTYIPGNRTGDRNLALLEDGEYVLNRQAVSSIGVDALNQMNYGMYPRFQSGGGFGMAAQMGVVNGENDFTGQLMQSNLSNQGINYEDYTAYAFAEDEYFKKTREKAVQAEQERIQKLYQDRVKNLQLMTSIMGAVGSIALGAGMSGLASGAAKTASQVGKAASQGAIQGTSEVGQKAIEQFKAGDITSSQLTKLIKVNPSNFTSTFGGSLGQAGLKTNLFGNVTNRSLSNLLTTQGFTANVSNNFAGNLLQSGLGNARSLIPKQQTGGLVGYQSGGYIPYGSRISDNVPRYMSGGMNLMSNNANQKYIMSSTPRFESGGANNAVSNTTNNSTNSTNIAINIDKSGNTVIGQSGNNYSNNEYQFSQQLAKVVAKIADSRISDARRSGGELSKRTS